MKSVMISIKPKWCELIANGEKTIDVRKTKPKIETPFKCYIYCTKEKYKNKYLHTSNKKNRLLFWHNKGDCEIVCQPENTSYIAHSCFGKVIGEFICDKIDEIRKRGFGDNFDYCYLSLNVWGNDDIEIEITDIKKSCIQKAELNEYGKNSRQLYAWHISDLKIYDEPKELSEFRMPIECHRGKQKENCQGCWDCEMKTLPKSWCYVESVIE